MDGDHMWASAMAASHVLTSASAELDVLTLDVRSPGGIGRGDRVRVRRCGMLITKNGRTRQPSVEKYSLLGHER